MMIECKAMNIPLDKTVLWQVLHYNIAIPVKYLVVTNGQQCYAYGKAEIDFEEMQSVLSRDTTE